MKRFLNYDVKAGVARRSDRPDLEAEHYFISGEVLGHPFSGSPRAIVFVDASVATPELQQQIAEALYAEHQLGLLEVKVVEFQD